MTVSSYSQIPLNCPAVSGPSQPLLWTSGAWTKTLRIPYSSFNGLANDPYITQYFTVYQNGTFLASDDAGNRFETASPTLHLPGAVTTTLLSNSTTAVQTTYFGAGPKYSANITLSFSVYSVACQPAGIRVEASGGANWGSLGKGVVSIPFKTKPTSITGYTAWFGTPAIGAPAAGHTRTPSNRTQALGFDWSDSKAQSPAFSPTSNSLSWQVGDSFLIDPTTVASTSFSFPLQDGYEGHVCYAQSLYWVFYYDGIYEGYRTSANYGNTWSGELTLSVSSAATEAVSFACSGNTVAYVSGDGYYSDTSKNWHYRFGTLTASGTIGWNMSSEATLSAAYNAPINVQVVFDSNNNLWAQLDTYKPVILNGKPQDYGTSYAEVWEGTGCSSSGCAWTNKLAEINAWPGVLVPLTQGKLGFVYQNTNCGTDVMFWSNSSWTSSGVTGGNCGSHYDMTSSGYTSLNDTIEMAFNDPVANVQGYVSVPYATSPVWGTPLTVESDSGGTASIATDNSTTLVLYIGHSKTVNYYTSSNSGTTWSTANAIASNNESASVSDMDAMPQFYGNSSVVWAAGSTIRFQAVPDGPSPTWGMRGVSPYESYLGDLQVHVSPGSGLLTVTQTDLYLPGKGMDLAITRVYSEPLEFSSCSPYCQAYPQYDTPNTGFMGQGWSLDFPWLGLYNVHLSGGQAIPYAWKGNVFAYDGVTDFNLTRNSNPTSYTLVLRDGRVYQFNSAYQLQSITDRAGDTIHFHWSAGCTGQASVITSIVDTDGRTVAFNYDDCNYNNGGFVQSITYGSRTWIYTPDSLGTRLDSVTDPAGLITSYSYDQSGYLMNQLTYATGGYATFGYHSVSITHGYIRELVNSYKEYNIYGQDANGESISYSVQKTGNVSTATATSSGSISYYKFLSGSMQLYSESTLGKTIQMTRSDLDHYGRIGLVVTFGSNAKTLIGESATTYDDWGNVKRETDYSASNTNLITYYEYANTNSNKAWPCTKINFYSSNPVPQNVYDDVTGVCSNGGKVQEYIKYDGNGFPSQSKRLDNPGGGANTWFITDYGYSGALLTSVYVEGGSYSISYGYDSKGVLDSQTGGNTYALNPVTEFATAMTDPGGYHFTFQNDPDGRLKSVGEPGNYHVNITYIGNTVEIEDENGHNTTETYDGLGRLSSVSGPINSESYTYNWLGEVLSDTTPDHSYSYSYDALGRPTSVADASGTYSLTYPGTKNAVNVTDGDGHIVTYTYNWRNWLTSVSTYPPSSTTSYTYDKVGDLTKATVAGQSTNYYYDDVGNLYKTVYPGSTTQETAAYYSDGMMKSRVSPNGTTTTYQYNNLDELTGITYAGSTLSFGYDGYGHVTSSSGSGFATLSRHYNWRGELTSETDGGLTTTYNYDPAGNLQSIQYPDNSVVSMTYDSQNRLQTVTGGYVSYVTGVSYCNQGNVPSTLTYGSGATQTFSYDSQGRLTGANGVSFGLDGAGNVGAGGYNGAAYTYNSLNQLTGSSGGLSTAYTYDQAGNLLTMTENGVTTNLNYPAQNHLNELNTTSVNHVTKTTYTYDKDGNMINRNGTAQAFTYNYLDMMTNVVKSGQTVETNAFDGLGRRVSRTMNGVTTTYAYVGDKILYEHNSTTSIDHVYGDGFQVAEVVNGIVYYPVQNYVGSTVILHTNSNPPGTSFAANYSPWGRVSVTAGSLGHETLTFTEMPYDSVTGLYFFGTRFYDPTIGRFVQQDSFAGVLANPLSLNRYVYADDNPMTFSDNSGHDALTTALLFGAVVGLTIVSVVQLGLDPATDVADAASISALTASVAGGGAVVGATATEVAENPSATEDAEAFLTHVSNTAVSAVQEVFGGLEKETIPLAEPVGVSVPDLLNQGAMAEVKVGISPDQDVLDQMARYIQAIAEGKANSMTYYFLQSPVTGRVGPSPEVLTAIQEYALQYPIRYVVWDYNWWEGME